MVRKGCHIVGGTRAHGCFLDPNDATSTLQRKNLPLWGCHIRLSAIPRTLCLGQSYEADLSSGGAGEILQTHLGSECALAQTRIPTRANESPSRRFRYHGSAASTDRRPRQQTRTPTDFLRDAS